MSGSCLGMLATCLPPSDYEPQHDKPVPTGTQAVDEGTQSEPDSLVLELKLQNIIL